MISLLLFIGYIFTSIPCLLYVGATDILPEPLSREEELFYLSLAQDNDKHAKDILIEHNLRLVVFLAKKYENTKVDLEDLVSIGTIGLIKGINTFSMNKNIKLATYASRCIDNEILMFLRKNKRVRGEVSFEESLSYDADGNELHLEDVLGTDADIVTKGLEEDDNKKIMMAEIEKLNVRDREIMILRYGLNGHKEQTQKEVADLLGISQSYISRIEKKVIKRLKNIVKV
ncbi:MAG: RNA polymerase sporulation sigma factor SigK [Bacilli bacterium]